MEAWRKLGKALRRYVNPGTFPLAIKFLKEAEELPEDARFPGRDMQVKLAHCQAQAIARKYGWTLVMTPEDLGCAISGHTYGWKTADPDKAVDFLTRMNYAADPESALRVLLGFRTLAPGACRAVVYSPLEWTKIVPDVILIYLNPAQLMRCLHGSTQRTGEPVTSAFTGRAATCTEGVLGAHLDQAPKVVVPGNGDRVWASAQDHEMAYALPAAHLPDLVEGLGKTHERGIRYPIPSYLRFQPEVGLRFPLLDIF
jgi:uncharacterized protein (DUF169 family)